MSYIDLWGNSGLGR